MTNTLACFRSTKDHDDLMVMMTMIMKNTLVCFHSARDRHLTVEKSSARDSCNNKYDYEGRHSNHFHENAEKAATTNMVKTVN